MLASVQPAPAAIAPAIDGNASAAPWKRAVPLRLQVAGEPVIVYVLEDERYIYIAARAVQREHVCANNVSDDTPMTRDDALTLDFTSGAQSLRFSMNPFGAHAAHSSSKTPFAPSWKSAGRVLSDGYEVTARIPRDLLASNDAWTLSVTRRIAALDKTSESKSVPLALTGSFTTVPKAKIVAGAEGEFSGKYRSLWPTPDAPDVPPDAGGVAVRDTRQGITVAALDAHTASREDDAQSVVYKTPDERSPLLRLAFKRRIPA